MSTIPYHTLAKLRQIDPQLDANWQQKLQNLLIPLDNSQKTSIIQDMLLPQRITWDQQQNHFVFQGKITLNELIFKLSHQHLQNLAEKVLGFYPNISSTQDIVKLADHIERILAQIDQSEGEENLSAQKERIWLRQVFLYDMAALIQQQDLECPTSARKLNLEEIRGFMIHVYLKHQILGYWFKTVIPRQLQQTDHPFLSKFLYQQQKVRHFDIIHHDQYLYIIATNQAKRQNPYSIRRFLKEERLGLDQQLYLNGTIIDLSKLQNATYLNSIKWQISRIITLQQPISSPVLDFLEELHRVNLDEILPLLNTQLDISHESLEQSLNERLKHVEKMITQRLLLPLEEALQQLIQHPDEYEYCYESIHHLLLDLIGAYKDFASEPTINSNTQVKIFEYRLTSYLKLLEKRKDHIFRAYTAQEYQNMDSKAAQAIQQVKIAIDTGLKESNSQKVLLKKKQREAEDAQNTSFFKKIFTRVEKVQSEIESILYEEQQIQRRSYLEIVKIPKVHQSTTVYVEFENLISINETERHYAFAQGLNGMTFLPIIIRLPEDRAQFNLQKLSEELNFALSKERQKWLTAS